MKIKFLILSLLCAGYVFATPPVEEGKTIFTTRCAGCHNVNRILTGPALAGVEQRHSIDWIINFVHSSQTVIKNGDQTAVALFNKFNHIQMPDHPDLTADNIKSIVEYIKSEAAAGGGDGKAPFATPTVLKTPYTPIQINNYSFFAFYLAAVVLLIGGLVFAARVKTLGSKMQE